MNKDKVLVLGRGFLGSAFERNGYKVVGRDDFSFYEEYDEHDVTRWDKLFAPYDVVINCIARSDTRWCEEDENFEELMEVNAQLPRYLSCAVHRTGKKLVHISTGCLYDSRGAGKSYEGDFSSAHCNYVVSKWAGEIGRAHV